MRASNRIKPDRVTGLDSVDEKARGKGEDEVLVCLVAMDRHLLVGCDSASRATGKREPESLLSPNAGVRLGCGDTTASAEDLVGHARPGRWAESKRKASDEPEGGCTDGRLARWDIVEPDDIVHDHRIDNGIESK